MGETTGVVVEGNWDYPGEAEGGWRLSSTFEKLQDPESPSSARLRAR